MLRNPFNRAVRYRDGLPVLPFAYPGIGHLGLLHADAVETFRWARDHLGSLFWVKNGFAEWSVMCIAGEGFDVFRHKAASVSFLKELASTMMGEALLCQDGDTHQRMRGAMNAPFTPRGIASSGIGSVIAELVVSRVARWAEQRTIPIFEEALELTLAVIFRIIGVEVDKLEIWGEQYRDFVLSAIPPIPDWIPGSPRPRAARARAWLDAELFKIVKSERARPRSHSFISELAHGHDERGRTLSERELIDNLRLLTFAGHETTASALAWLTITLARRPDLWSALCEEASHAAALPATLQDTRSFPVADGLLRETLRLYPPVALTARKLVEPVMVCGERIPAGVMFAIALSALGRDPALYADPDSFDPARWIGRGQPPTPLEICQFGGGPHFCLGYHLAWLEMTQFAVALAQQMRRRGLRPRLADGPEPRYYTLPLGHPSRKTRIDFVQS